MILSRFCPSWRDQRPRISRQRISPTVLGDPYQVPITRFWIVIKHSLSRPHHQSSKNQANINHLSTKILVRSHKCLFHHDLLTLYLFPRTAVTCSRWALKLHQGINLDNSEEKQNCWPQSQIKNWKIKKEWRVWWDQKRKTRSRI